MSDAPHLITAITPAGELRATVQGDAVIEATFKRKRNPPPRPAQQRRTATGASGRRCCGETLIVRWLGVRWLGVPAPVRWFRRARVWRGRVAPYRECGCLYKLLLLWRVMKA